MRPSVTPELDDREIDALLRGDVPPRAGHLASFVAGARAIAGDDPPRPTPELARALGRDSSGAPRLTLVPSSGGRAGTATAAAPTEVATERGHRGRTLVGRAAGVALVAKIGLGAAVAAASVGGAAALPGATGDAVRHAIDVVTPLDLDDAPANPPAGDAPAPDTAPDAAGEHGDTVSSDATGDADGIRGVDGRSVADDAPGADRRPADGNPPAVGTRPGTDPPPSLGGVGGPGTDDSTVPGHDEPGDDDRTSSDDAPAGSADDGRDGSGRGDPDAPAASR